MSLDSLTKTLSIRVKQTMSIKASYVFLDTDVFVEANFDYTSPRLASITSLAITERIQVFTTDLTVREVKANIRASVEGARTVRPAPIFRNSKLPEIKQLFGKIDMKRVERELVAQFDEFLTSAKVITLPVQGEALNPVLDRYFDRKPPFGAAAKRKSEFPDALVIETLSAWCAENARTMAVVSRDGGVGDACAADVRLHHFGELSAYLDAVASEETTLSAFIREMIPRLEPEIFEMAKKQFGQLGFYLDDQDGDVEEVELIFVDFYEDIEIISLTHNSAQVEIPATVKFTANLTYADPNTGVWDGEDKVLMFQEQREESVEREDEEVTIGVEVVFAGLEQSPFRVVRVWFEAGDIAVSTDYDAQFDG